MTLDSGWTDLLDDASTADDFAFLTGSDPIDAWDSPDSDLDGRGDDLQGMELPPDLLSGITHEPPAHHDASEVVTVTCVMEADNPLV